VNPDWQKKSKEEKAAISWHGAQGLAADVRYYGQWMRDEAEKRIGHLYPKVKITKEMAKDRPDLKQYVGEELTVIAWLWARTVASSNPLYQGVHVPLVTGFWLGKKPGKEAWVEPIVDRKDKAYHFLVRTGPPSAIQKKAIEEGTKLGRGCNFRCLLSDEPIPEAHVKDEGMKGRLGTRLMVIVAEGNRGRVYLSPLSDQERHASNIRQPDDMRIVDATIALDKRAIWCLLYGLDTFAKLFTPRQLVALTTFSDLVQEARGRISEASATVEFPRDQRALAECGAGPIAYADAVATYLGIAASKCADGNSAICSWMPGLKYEVVRTTFSRQGLPMTWDHAEANPFAGSSGDYREQLNRTSKVLDIGVPQTCTPIGSSVQLDACQVSHQKASVVSTDPPYYDNIGYADLSDFFYVWLRRSLGTIYPSLFATVLTPKNQELIASPYRHGGSKAKAQEFFEVGLGEAFNRTREAQNHAFPMTVYYAFKQAETEQGDDEDNWDSDSVSVSTGWETMLGGLIHSGFAITGTWPMRTERSVRSIGIGTNALASSIVLVCRRRPADAPLATRMQFITALRQELPDALRNLQHSNIAPVDLAQAAIGPGMAVFTRYAKVMETDGSPMSVRTALGLINQALDEVLAEQEGEFDGDTRWAIAWFEQFGMDEGLFGVAEILSKAKNSAVNCLVEAGIITARGGKVKLVPRTALPDAWDPAREQKVTNWEVVQHLIRALEHEGEVAAGALVARLGGLAEIARDLAYRLYVLCERKKWAEEALAYNGLVIAWPELTKLALAERTRPKEIQREMI
jgi:putative DNA methylase